MDIRTLLDAAQSALEVSDDPLALAPSTSRARMQHGRLARGVSLGDSGMLKFNSGGIERTNFDRTLTAAATTNCTPGLDADPACAEDDPLEVSGTPDSSDYLALIPAFILRREEARSRRPGPPAREETPAAPMAA